MACAGSFQWSVDLLQAVLRRLVGVLAQGALPSTVLPPVLLFPPAAHMLDRA